MQKGAGDCEPHDEMSPESRTGRPVDGLCSCVQRPGHLMRGGLYKNNTTHTHAHTQTHTHATHTHKHTHTRTHTHTHIHKHTRTLRTHTHTNTHTHVKHTHKRFFRLQVYQTVSIIRLRVYVYHHSFIATVYLVTVVIKECDELLA